MVFAAAKPNAEALELIYPEDDPDPTQITVKAGETLTGKIDLQDIVRDLNAAKKSDVLLFWAYKALATLRLPRWIGGWLSSRNKSRRLDALSWCVNTQ